MRVQVVIESYYKQHMSRLGGCERCLRVSPSRVLLWKCFTFQVDFTVTAAVTSRAALSSVGIHEGLSMPVYTPKYAFRESSHYFDNLLELDEWYSKERSGAERTGIVPYSPRSASNVSQADESKGKLLVSVERK